MKTAELSCRGRAEGLGVQDQLQAGCSALPGAFGFPAEAPERLLDYVA